MIRFLHFFLDQIINGVSLVVVRPHFTLTHDGFNGILVLLRWIFVFFQKPFHQFAHTGASGFFFLPVDRSVFPKRFC